MRKFWALCVSLVFVVSLAVSPVFAVGDKEQGDVGAGSVDQGSTGSDAGRAPGSDAQGNQVD